jgi:glucosamine--fructose-6-phosphate aminotransferase (isomerizing)
MNNEYQFIKEIREQPNKISESLMHADKNLKDIAERYSQQIERVIMVGCGDPYMLGIGATYAFEKWAQLPSESIEAAEFTSYRHNLIDEHTLVILISSSGKTVKVIDAAKLAAQKGAPRFSLTNLNPSPITDETDEVIHTQAGWSDSFPTKQTTTALANLYALALHIAEARNSFSTQDISMLRQELYSEIPKAIEESLKLESQMEKLAQNLYKAPIYTFIGSGPNLATAQLAAAKMKETSQSRAESTNLEEYAHLHALSLKNDDPVFIITRPGDVGERDRLVSQHVKSNGGQIIVIGTSQDKELWSELDAKYYTVPGHNEMFGPLVAWIPLQMFAYFTAISKDCNPDRPPERGPMDFLQKIIYTSILEGWFDR